MSFEKLVGDKVADNMRAQGLEPDVRRAVSDEEYECHLRLKLCEEVEEFRRAEMQGETLKEAGDILGVLDAIWTFRKIIREEVFALVTRANDLIILDDDEAIDFIDEMEDYAERLDYCKSPQDIASLSAAIIDALGKALCFYGLSPQQALQAECENAEKRGRFETRTIMLMEREGVGVIKSRFEIPKE